MAVHDYIFRIRTNLDDDQAEEFLVELSAEILGHLNVEGGEEILKMSALDAIEVDREIQKMYGYTQNDERLS